MFLLINNAYFAILGQIKQQINMISGFCLQLKTLCGVKIGVWKNFMVMMR